MASEDVLKREADRMNYRLRFTKETDTGGYSEQ